MDREPNAAFSPTAGSIEEPTGALASIDSPEKVIDTLDEDVIRSAQEEELLRLRAQNAELLAQLGGETVDPAKLEILPFSNKGKSLTRPARTIKMVKPQCNGRAMGLGEENCQELGGQWWEKCEKAGHSPYFNVWDQTVKEPVIEKQEDGTLEITQYKERIVRRISPRTAQVALTLRSNSGQGVEKVLRRGYKFFEDKGFHPVCQFWNCWNPNIKHRTPYGDYCSRDEAALMYLVEEGIAYEVYSAKVIRQQLNSVPV